MARRLADELDEEAERAVEDEIEGKDSPMEDAAAHECNEREGAGELKDQFIKRGGMSPHVIVIADGDGGIGWRAATAAEEQASGAADGDAEGNDHREAIVGWHAIADKKLGDF